MMERNKMKIPFITLMLVLGIAAPATRAEVVNKIVAVVGDRIITLNELEQACASQESNLGETGSTAKLDRKEVLERMIEKLLVDQEVKRQGVAVTNQEIEQAIDKKRQQLGLSQAEFYRALREQGMSIDDYREQVRQSLGMAKLVSNEVKSSTEITDPEIQAYYEKHKDEFYSSERVHLYHIVLRDSPEAENTMKIIRQKLAKGASFQELARLYSEGEEAKSGGDLGWVDLDQLKMPVRKLVSDLPLGKVSQVYVDEVGSHLFFVQGREKGSQLELDKVKERIREILFEKQFQNQYAIWLERLKAKTYIEIRL